MSWYTLTGFGDEIDASLDIQLREMDKLGYSHIELRGVDGKNISTYDVQSAKVIKSRLDEKGFKVSAMGSPIGKIDITADFGEHLEVFKKMLDVCNVLDTRYMRLFSFFMPKGDEPMKWRKEVLNRMEKLVRAAEGSGVTLLHENERDIYGDVASRCWDIFHTINSPILRMTYDPANFRWCSEDNQIALPMLWEFVEYVHLKDCIPVSTGEMARDMGFENVSSNHWPVGQGEAQIEYVLGELIARGYKGYLSLEPHLVANPKLPGGPLDRFTAATQALVGLLNRVESAKK